MENKKQELAQKMQDNIEAFKSHLRKMRTGRAQSSLLENIKISYYGSLTSLVQLASISTPTARSLVITPFDIKALKDIEQAIVKANIGMTPQNDGKLLRLNVPELTEESRKNLAKEIKKESEKCRVDLRNTRRAVNDEIKKMVKDKEISEDDQQKWKNESQKTTDQFMSEVEQLTEMKEKEVMEL